MAFVSTGTAAHTDIQEKPKRPVPIQPLFESLENDFFPVGR
jgi:hypothetical protein